MKYRPSEIKKTFNSSASRSSIMASCVIRPLSFYVTSFVLEFNMNPAQATALSLVFGIMSALAFIGGSHLLFALGVLLYFLAVIFDYVDGNIARITDSATYFGKFADGAVDVFTGSFVPLAIALGFYFAGHSIYFLFAGIGTSMFLLFSFFIINRASFMHRWAKTDELEGRLPPGTGLNSSNPFKAGTIPVYEVSNFVADASMLVLIVAAIIGMTPALFIMLFTMLAVRAAVLIASAVFDAAMYLKIHRISKSDPHLRQK